MANNQQNFGKGLQSLIPQKNASAPSAGGATGSLYPKVANPLRQVNNNSAENKKESVFNVETGNIIPNSHQPRNYFDPEKLQELARSIKEHGILQPLIVTKTSPDIPAGHPVKYQLIAGERRLEAAKLIKLPHVPVIIRDSSRQQRLEMALVENIQRADLNPLESALAFKKLQEEFGLTHKEIAEKVGKSREAISNTIRLLGLPEEMKQALRKGVISDGHARVLVGIQNQRNQKKLFEETIASHLSVRQIEERARAIEPQKSRPRKKINLPPFLQKIQTDLEKLLGSRVALAGSKDQGKITILYKSAQELSKVLEKLK